MEEIKKLAQVHKILDFHVKKNPDNVSLSIDSISYTNSDILSKVLSFVGLLKKNKELAIIDFGDLAKTQLVNEVAIAMVYASYSLENPLVNASIILKSYNTARSMSQCEFTEVYLSKTDFLSQAETVINNIQHMKILIRMIVTTLKAVVFFVICL